MTIEATSISIVGESLCPNDALPGALLVPLNSGVHSRFLSEAAAFFDVFAGVLAMLAFGLLIFDNGGIVPPHPVMHATENRSFLAIELASHLTLVFPPEQYLPLNFNCKAMVPATQPKPLSC